MNSGSAYSPEQKVILKAYMLNFMVELFLVAAGYMAFLFTFIFCIHFLIRDCLPHLRQSNKNASQVQRKQVVPFLLYPIGTFICFTLFTIAIYSSLTNVVLCSTVQQNPVGVCEVLRHDPGKGWNATVRYIFVGFFSAIVYLIADVMLFHRAMVIWQGNKLIMIALGSMLLAANILNIYISFPSTFTDQLNLAAFSLLAAYDIITTSIIAARLLYYRRQSRILGPKGSKVYTSLMAVFFESSFLTSSTRVVAAATIFTSSNAGRWTIPLSTAASAISPMFIILRLALNEFNDTYDSQAHISTIVFTNGRGDNVQAQMSTFLGGAVVDPRSTAAGFDLESKMEGETLELSPVSPHMNGTRVTRIEEDETIGSYPKTQEK